MVKVCSQFGDYFTTNSSSKFTSANINYLHRINFEACFVINNNFQTRHDEATLFVIDHLVNERLRGEFLSYFTNESDFNETIPLINTWNRTTSDIQSTYAKLFFETCLKTLGPRWGCAKYLCYDVLPAVLELKSRLATLYDEYYVHWMPSFISKSKLSFDNKLKQPSHTHQNFQANASTHGDTFAYHFDADPSIFPNSCWTEEFGRYTNRDPGMPLLVSVLVYLNPFWKQEWGGETLFLDSSTSTGFFVIPKPARVVLMDQDILHRVSSPTCSANKPRFSMVWKLALLRKDKTETLTCRSQRITFTKSEHTTLLGSAVLMRNLRRRTNCAT